MSGIESPSAPARGRILWLDSWRGCAVLVMIGWHFCWDLGLLGVWPQERMFTPLAVAVRYYIVCSFVVLSGISARLSRSNLRRGLKTLGCAMVVTLVTWIAGDPAWFGVLHLLGCCMLLYAWLGPKLEKLPEVPALAVCLLLFLILHEVCYHTWVSVPGLWIFGLRTRTFSSSDYYPLFPWLFLFLSGAIAGRRVKETALSLPAPAFLRWVGQHALWIYMIHQPVLLGLVKLYTVLRGGV